MLVEPNAPNQNAADPAGIVLRLALRGGVGVGVVCALWMLGLHLTGNNAFGPKQLLAQLLVPLVAVGNEWWLRRQLAPQKPGLARSLGVGLLTVVIAAVVSASSLVGLAHGAGEPALARNRAEIREIVQAQQRENAKVIIPEAQQRAQLQQVDDLTVGNLASSNFTQVLLLGLILAVPAGIFLRE